MVFPSSVFFSAICRHIFFFSFPMTMADRPKLLYIIVRDGDLDSNDETGNPPLGCFRYTLPVLQSTLQFIGCKARHAFKISKRVFEILAQDKNGCMPNEFFRHDSSRYLSDSEIDSTRDYSPEEIKKAAEENEIKLKEITKKLYDVQKKRSTIVLNRRDFMNVVCDGMSEYRYIGPNQRNDFALACKIREKRTSVTILLCGTSGCGKSTLSTLLASRLGITTVVSTDSIRHMMRSFIDENQCPLLYASTYSAGEHLDPVAVAEAKMKKLAKKMAGKVKLNGNGALSPRECMPGQGPEDKGKFNVNEGLGEVPVNAKTMAIEGYKAQSEMVIDSLDRLITSWEQKCESVIVEGVHLSLDFVIELMKKHPTIIPFMIYIANEEKHLERFAVRAKYMTLDPAKNKYVKYIRNIRAIQDYQCKKADKHLVPKVNNTNMDQSVAFIHATIFACLRRKDGGEPYYDEITNTVKMVDDEYKNQRAAYSLGSKGMFQIIRRRGSSRHLMALLNTDGSVAKAWPVEMLDRREGEKTTDSCKNNLYSLSCPYEPLEVSSVNLRFGSFGLSAWQNDEGGTSYGGNADGSSSKGDILECQSSHQSSLHGSCCSGSPRLHEGTDKELLVDNRVAWSDEEQELLDFDSEEENNDRDQQLEAEVEGSVADGSIASDEEEDYNPSMEQGSYTDTRNVGDANCKRTIYRTTSQNGHDSLIPSHQKPNAIKHGIPLTESGRMNLLGNENHSRRGMDDLTDREHCRKHFHGRSRSFSLAASYGSY